MGAVVVLDALVHTGRVWRGQPASVPELAMQPTGHADLDAVLPARGWPVHALTEILLPADGVGELQHLLFQREHRLCVERGDLRRRQRRLHGNREPLRPLDHAVFLQARQRGDVLGQRLLQLDVPAR